MTGRGEAGEAGELGGGGGRRGRRGGEQTESKEESGGLRWQNNLWLPCWRSMFLLVCLLVRLAAFWETSCRPADQRLKGKQEALQNLFLRLRRPLGGAVRKDFT